MKSYSTLIQDIIDKSYSPDSYGPIKKALKIEDPAFLSELIAIIPNVVHLEQRRSLYTVIGNYGEKTKDLAATIFLIDRLKCEEEQWTAYRILTALSQLTKPIDFDFQPIINLLKKRGQIRQGAICALTGAKGPHVETALIQLFPKIKSDLELEYICNTFASIDAKSAVPYLIQLLKHKKVEVVSAALDALAIIEQKNALPIYIEQLQQANYLVKPTAMSAILDYADDSAVQAVINRIKVVLSRKRKTETIYLDCFPEIVEGFIYLKRYEASFPEIPKLFNWVLMKKYANLQKDEANWVNHNIKRL